MLRFADGKTPVAPWSLHLNFNHENKAIKLEAAHFTKDGEDITAFLTRSIESIDPGWKVKGAEPVFEEAATRKRLKISEHTAGEINIDAMFKNAGKPRQTTFYSVIEDVFGEY